MQTLNPKTGRICAWHVATSGEVLLLLLSGLGGTFVSGDLQPLYKGLGFRVPYKGIFQDFYKGSFLKKSAVLHPTYSTAAL